MNLIDFFKVVHPSVLAAKMIFRHLNEHFPVLKISDIADTSSGGTPNRGMPEYYNGNIPWVKSGELKDGLITRCEEYITEAGVQNSSAKLFPKGTLLVAMYGANIGKTGVLDFDATTNQAVCAIFPKIDISKDYLFWYFKQQRIDFIAIGKGGAQPNISQTVINNASIVVPDPDIQNKIVRFLEKIENSQGVDSDFFIPEVLKDVETIYRYKSIYINLSESFDNQLSLLDTLNQAILQEAVQGKLVIQDPNDEPASELLKRIKAEKAKSGKKEKPLPPIKPEEIPFEIPESWVWCRLFDIISILGDGIHGTPNYDPTGDYYFINGNNLINGKIEIKDSTKRVSESEYLKFRKPLIHNTVFVSINGTLGNLAYYNGEQIILGKSACYFNLHQEVLREYIGVFIKSSYFLKYAVDVASETTIKNVSLKSMRLLPIPLPPLFEQKRIVAEIERQFAKTKALKDHVLANQQATEQLLKALLHQAFEVK
jgi:type I restriction enzyme S subunit